MSFFSSFGLTFIQFSINSSKLSRIFKITFYSLDSRLDWVMLPSSFYCLLLFESFISNSGQHVLFFMLFVFPFEFCCVANVLCIQGGRRDLFVSFFYQSSTYFHFRKLLESPKRHNQSKQPIRSNNKVSWRLAHLPLWWERIIFAERKMKDIGEECMEGLI